MELEALLRDLPDIPALKKQLVEEMRASRIRLKEIEEKGVAGFMSADEDGDDWEDTASTTSARSATSARSTTPSARSATPARTTTPATTPVATPRSGPASSRRTPASMSRRAVNILAANAKGQAVVSSESESDSDTGSDGNPTLKETVPEQELREQRELLYKEHALKYENITKDMTVVVVYDGEPNNPGERPIDELYKGVVERKNKHQGIKVIYPDDGGASFQWEHVSSVLKYTTKFDAEIKRTADGKNPITNLAESE